MVFGEREGIAMENVIIDTDAGVDDAIAIILALKSPEINVLGITTVNGNVPVDKATENVIKILNYIKRMDIPVYKGAYKPICGEAVNTSYYHGSDGLGDVGLNLPRKYRIMEKHAVNFLLEATREYSDVTIVTLGPLTNIALAILLDEDFPKRVKKFVSMCGTYGVTKYGIGSLNTWLEFNASTDPIATKIYLSTNAEKYLIGLDVTQKPNAMLTNKDLQKFRSKGGVGILIYNMLSRLKGKIPLHDPITIAYLIDNTILKFKELYVDVEVLSVNLAGMTITDLRDVPEWLKEGYKANIAVDINGQKYKQLLLNRL